MYKLPERGGRGEGGEVIRAMPERKHSFFRRCSLSKTLTFEFIARVLSFQVQNIQMKEEHFTAVKARFWDHEENCKLKSLRTLKMSVKDNSIQTCDWRQIAKQKDAKHLFSFYLHPNIS